MLLSILELFVLLQSGVHGDGSSAPLPQAGADAAQGAPSAAGGSAMMQVLMIGGMFAFMYFVMIRPQQKRQREMDAMLKALSKGDVVRTTGGVRGEITDLTDRDVTLLIADKVKINVLRSAIAGPDVAPKPADASSKEKGN